MHSLEKKINMRNYERKEEGRNGSSNKEKKEEIRK
jgi:hypothetical protein